MSFLELLQNVWVRRAAVVVVWAGTLLAAFAMGKYMTPPQVIETQKVVVQEHEVLKVVEVEKKIIERNTDSAESKRVHKERTEETRPDGTKVVKETTDIGVDKTVKEVEVKYVDRTNTVEKIVEVEKKVEVEKIVKTAKPDWDLSVKAGVLFTELPHAIEAGSWNSPIVVGVEVDRRIVGPFKLGLWANSNLAFNNVSGGLSAGLEF